MQTDSFVEGSYGNGELAFRFGLGYHFDLGSGLSWPVVRAFARWLRRVPTHVRGQLYAGRVRIWLRTLRLERLFGEHGRAFLAGSIYGEDRQNGTPLQVNDTTDSATLVWYGLEWSRGWFVHPADVWAERKTTTRHFLQ